MSSFAAYFDRVAVINLPARRDRLRSIKIEISKLGISENVVEIPEAPIPLDDGGFPSRGVFGNYLSHLSILKGALAKGTKRLLVLEDDAIFSRAARSSLNQSKILQQVEGQEWSMWFLGHKLRSELRKSPKGAIPNDMEFHWAHAYAVHHESLTELIDFLERSMARPSGYGIGKMYIDGAFYHYRSEEASKPCLVSNPALSIQKGSDSNLAGPRSPGQVLLRHLPRELARKSRDEFWRWTNEDFR